MEKNLKEILFGWCVKSCGGNILDFVILLDFLRNMPDFVLFSLTIL
jgi:hypothetical protein